MGIFRTFLYAEVGKSGCCEMVGLHEEECAGCRFPSESETGRSCPHRWCSLAGVGALLWNETGRGTIEKWIWAGDDGKVLEKFTIFEC